MTVKGSTPSKILTLDDQLEFLTLQVCKADDYDKVMQHTWVYQKVPRLSSTDRKQMALGEYLRYD